LDQWGVVDRNDMINGAQVILMKTLSTIILKNSLTVILDIPLILLVYSVSRGPGTSRS
jgi:hypothetical protein